MIKLYGIKSCDSVKKALKFFKEASIELEFIDFKENRPSQNQVRAWADKTDLSKLFNKQSRTYKDLGLSKLTLSDTEKIDWMQKEPLLIKRPLIEYHNDVIIGFDESIYKGVFKI